LRSFPKLWNKSIEIYPDTATVHRPGTIDAGRDEYSNRFRLSYTEPVDSISEIIPFISDDRLICELLEDTLHRKVSLGEKFPDVWTDIIYSQPVDSLLRPMMVESDNFFAEQLLLLCSYVLSDSLEAEKTIRFAEANYFPELKDGMYWVDGSGLSRYNQFTPHAITGILRMLYLDYGKEFIRKIFPEGGVSGTIKKNFPGSIVAKTGSMSHVYNLSGYLLTRRGKWLAFSFMNNNFTVPSSEIRREMVKVLLAVRDNL
jgi:serine-type D-Ala-D-Ala carboxypeptidase/endopeptidase (penicillin-binding protein 4)